MMILISDDVTSARMLFPTGKMERQGTALGCFLANLGLEGTRVKNSYHCEKVGKASKHV